MNYNSPRWQAFRRNVPFKVRWFIGLPVFAVYLLASAITGLVAGVKEFWWHIVECFRKCPSFWDKDR